MSQSNPDSQPDDTKPLLRRDQPGEDASPRSELLSESRAHHRRRLRRRGRRAYIRSVYLLPSMATLGNAICGFAAIYVAALDSSTASPDPIAQFMAEPAHRFLASAYFIFLAMFFDAIDGRLARFARHTTDFGGQLDSLADVISFGAAPAFLALQLFRTFQPHAPYSRLIWAIGAIYMSCAAIRLARFNVSNEHGEQHHFSFLGLPSPGAAGAVAALVLFQQEVALSGYATFSKVLVCFLPMVVLLTGLLMVSNIRYPHIVNQHLRGKRSLGRLLLGVILLLALLMFHRVTLAAACVGYALWGAGIWLNSRFFRRSKTPSHATTARSDSHSAPSDTPDSGN